ncbi:hypothetical protein QOZ80_8BG0666330 [Eleusine coracana subsp. coracana]|nr:hypothetical protein QOZ80_8BG0666330 [Eleusine coracana subsp. coracana]
MCLDDGGYVIPVSVDGETFFADPAVLAAGSPFLKDQLLLLNNKQNMMDDDNIITLSGIVEPDTFRSMLQFMRAGTLPLPSEEEEEELMTIDSLHRLLAAADTFRMDGLKTTCAQKLWERVSPETVAATLFLAETHRCPELKEKCIEYFFSSEGHSLTTITLSDGYRHIALFAPSLIDELRAQAGLETSSSGDIELYSLN